MPVDILAIAAHRDDVELTCAGTLLKAVDAGYRAGILDLTAGETGTRGSADLRADEASRAAAVLGIAERRNAGLPDAHLYNGEEARRIVVEQIRYFAPRVVILPFPVGRHPDKKTGHSNGSFLKAARAGMMTLVGPSCSSSARNGVSSGQV